MYFYSCRLLTGIAYRLLTNTDYAYPSIHVGYLQGHDCNGRISINVGYLPGQVMDVFLFM